MNIKGLTSCAKPIMLATIAAISLSACSSKNAPSDLAGDLFTKTVNSLTKLSKKKGSPGASTGGLTREKADANPVSLVHITLLSDNSNATAETRGKNGATTSYFLASGQAIYMRNGFVTGTRGLGNDIMSLSTSQPSLRAAAAAGSMQRVYRFLGDEDRLFEDRYSCRFTKGSKQTLTQLDRNYSVIPITETCQGETRRFKNTYMVDHRSGRVWLSDQWISATVGAVRIALLKP